MLKKRIGALILTAMVLGTAVTPVNAKTPVYEDVTVSQTIINETFDNCTPGTTGGSTQIGSIADTDETVTVKKYVSWNGVKPYTITEDNAISLTLTEGAYLNIANRNGSTPVNEGDIVKVSFKFRDESTINGNIIVNLNNNKKTSASFDAEGTMSRYTPKEGSGDDINAGKAGRAYPVWKDSSEHTDSRFDGRICNFFLNQGQYSIYGGWDSWGFKAHKYSKETWNDVTITINTKDADYDNQQTIRTDVKYTDENGNEVSTYFKGLYDANYTGTDDTTYDRLTSIDSIQFDSLTYQTDGNGGPKAAFDDIKVAIESTENRLTKIESDFNKTVINESLTNLGTDTSFKNGANSETPVNGSKTVSTRTVFSWGAQTAKATTEGLELNYDNGARLRIKNPNETTTLKAGDVVKVSLKAKTTANAKNAADSKIMMTFDGRRIARYSTTNPNATAEDGKVSRFTPKEGNVTGSTALRSYPFISSGVVNDHDKNVDGRLACINMARGKYALSNKMDSSWDGAEQKMSKNDWNDITITVNTKDADYDGKQTLRIDVSYTDENGVNESYIKGIFDADYNGTDDTTADMLDEIGDLIITSESGGYEPIEGYHAMFKDVNVSVLSPTFETWGTATMVDNVDGALEDTFIPGGLLDVKAQAFSDNAVLIVGSYNSDGVLASTKAVSAKEGNVLTAADIDTTGAEYIKLFLWNGEGGVTPYIESKTLTKAADASNTIH